LGLIDKFDAFCFDLDGTILLGNELLPGAKEIIDFIRKENKKIQFITNSPTQTRIDCQDRLHGLGITSDLEEIFTSAYISAIYFSKNFPESTVFIVGEQAIKEEFERLSVKMTNDPLESTHVLVGLDRSFTYEKLNSAMISVRNGAKIIVTNPDPYCPVSGGYIADTFSIARAIEVASGQTVFDVIGKPSTFYGDQMLSQLNIEKERCLIIGDRLETDVLLSEKNKFHSCLVLTGVASREDVEEKRIYPSIIEKDLETLLHYLEQ